MGVQLHTLFSFLAFCRRHLLDDMDIRRGQIILEEAYDETYEPTEAGSGKALRLPGLIAKYSIFPCRDTGLLHLDRPRPSHGEGPYVHCNRRNEGAAPAGLEANVSSK